MEEASRIRKLRWMCRRGMKELDVLLAAFLEEHLSDLQAGSWPEFEKLLELEDDRLWRYVQNPGDVAETSLQPIVRAIHVGVSRNS